MKIGITCPASLPATQFGGILFLGVDIARELSNLNHQVTIYTTDLDFANNPNTFNKKLPREENVQNFKIKRSHVWFSLKLFFVNPGIYFHMINDEQDVIHTIGIRSFQSLIAALVARKKKIPLVISDQGGLTTHPDLHTKNIWTKILYKIQSPMIQFVINRAKKIIVANEYEKKIFVELTDESKIEVVRNGINLGSMKSSVKFKKKYALDCNYFLFLGRFHKVKGVDLLLKAIHLIKNHPLMSNVKLVIMGVDFGFESEMFEMIKQMQLENVVQVIKNPPREDVIASYNESEFLVLPSRWELSPLTPLEGFAFKKPTISTKAHGIPYTLHDRKDSILVESEDFKELSDKIVELLNDKIKCTQLGIEGYQYVQKECNSKKMTHQILNIYEKIT
jgi:glycosyltransferase involved in cell wall biosynthesis|tara:strand:- start:2534 stop:3709 length:1176 start_codon:yes stop_codon:yes gene_type:complete